MNAWAESIRLMVKVLLGGPASTGELITILVLAVGAMLFVLSKAGGAFGITNTGVWYAIVVSAVGIALLLVGMSAVRLYVPQWSSPELRVWLLVGAGAVVSLVLVVPLMCALQKTKYIGAMLTWFISLGAAALVVVMVGAAFDAFTSGSRGAGKGVSHRQQLEDAMSE